MFRLQMYEIISTPNNQAVYILIDFLRHFRFQNRRSHKIETPKGKIITPFGQILSAFHFSEIPFRCGIVKEYLFLYVGRSVGIIVCGVLFSVCVGVANVAIFSMGRLFERFG